MTVRISRRALYAGILGLCAACAIALALLSTPRAMAAPAAPAPIKIGVVDALNSIERSVTDQGQVILDEKALEHARRVDAAAEQRHLNLMNEQSQQQASASAEATGAEAIVDDATPMAAAPTAAETIEDDATPMAAAPGTSTSRANAEEAESAAHQTVDVAEEVSEPAAEEDADTPEKKPAEKRKSTILVGGDYITYIQGSENDVEPPADTASTWFGDGSVGDGKHTYFIGHNPGVFKNVMDLQVGDKVTVWDDNGNKRTYYVYDTLVLSKTSNFYDYEQRLAPQGETITLQTCCGDNQSVRCVMAK